MNDKQIIKKLTEELELALGENKKLKEQLEGKWFDIKELTPKLGQEVIAFDGNKVSSGWIYTSDLSGKYYFTDFNEEHLVNEEITHWQPLPQPITN